MRLHLFHWIFISFILLLPLTGNGQNLVPNSGFEEYSTCPAYYTDGTLTIVPQWIQPTAGTPDYYHTCGSGPMQAPNCELGYQLPYSGLGFAGIYVYYANPLYRNYREYIQTRLTEPLRAGVIYKVSFFVSLSSEHSMAVDNLAAYFSVDPPLRSDWKPLINLSPSPQVRNPVGRFLTDTQNWIQIEGNFTAKGGEQYLTLGNFDDDQHTNLIGSSAYGYYYIDSISVYGCQQAINLGSDQVICPGDSLLLNASLNNVIYQWQDGSTDATYLVKEPGEYWIQAKDTLTGCIYNESIRISKGKCLEELDIPNVITPNGDKYNQYWTVKGMKTSWGIEIYNRWGKLVYQSQHYSNDWYGQEQAAGLYYYSLSNPLTRQVYKGWLQVLR